MRRRWLGGGSQSDTESPRPPPTTPFFFFHIRTVGLVYAHTDIRSRCCGRTDPERWLHDLGPDLQKKRASDLPCYLRRALVAHAAEVDIPYRTM